MKRKRNTIKRGYRTVPRLSFNEGFDKGYDAGHDRGYALGFERGQAEWNERFEGTSIVIPTYNQLEYLKACIDSIHKYTPERHEIIIIDNGSTDGTDQYLKSLFGNIRYKISKQNLGFAGGVNQGLMMARGSMLLFLNNDTIVTQNWLSNLLACLHGDEKYGLVGPVTNYISGDQLIETSYQTIDEMHRFAASFNRSDRGRWVSTNRLTGFCVLMKREFFQRLGYLDEGFEIGNCEDDDYGLRAQLLGADLIIANDTFLHHAGSKTIQRLTPSQFDEIYEKNKQFYRDKWGHTPSLLAEISAIRNGNALQTNDLYPTHVIVKGSGPALYWVEHGVLHPLEQSADFVFTRLAQTDLRNWPIGDALANEQVNQKIASLSSASPPTQSLADGALVKTPDGNVYQHKLGKLHRFITPWALTAWHLNERHMTALSKAEKKRYPEGIPIMAPPVIRASNL